ncbi:MAG: sigma-70 family RNA polymerase sigma factor [Planctomycetota bacterium]|jgi:RNA polymerase sigma factor (sigma-70 family)
MSKNRLNETELLKASIQGNHQAFGAIVSRYQSLVCAITFSATGDLEKSEELAQQAFVNVWQNLKQLQDLTKFQAWLCVTTRNVIRNFFRSQQRTAKRTQKTVENLIEAKSKMADPAEQAATKEQKAVLQNALEKISETYREPLVLFYRQEKSVKEVARQLELSEEAARQRISRARKMLREQVAKILESTLAKTKPGKAFTAGVIATISGLAVKTTATTAAGAALSAAGSKSGITAVLSTLTAKLITTAAVVAIGVGTIVAYKQINKPEPKPLLTQPPKLAQQIHQEPEEITEPITELPDEESAATFTTEEPTKNIEIKKTVDTPPPTIPVITKKTEYKFKPKGVLSGLITDANTGEPISGVEVEMWYKPPNYHAVTNEDGFYYFDDIPRDGNYKVKVYSPGYLSMTSWGKAQVIALQKGKQVVKHFEFERACQIEIQVVDEANEPIEGVRLEAISLDTMQTMPSLVPEQRTDANGMALLGGLKSSETPYMITAYHGEETHAKDKSGDAMPIKKGDYSPARLLVELSDTAVIEYGEIVMEAGAAVGGYAEYSDGVPAGGLRVCAYPDWWQTASIPMIIPIDPNGHFALPHIASGQYRIQVDIPHGQGSIGFNVLQTELPLDGELLVVRLPHKSPGSLVSISGKVRFVGGQRPGYVRVETFSERGPHMSQLGRDNTFKIDSLEPGTYRLQFSGKNLEEKIVENVKAPSSGLEVELRYATKPRLTGHVVHSSTTEAVRKFRARAKKVKTIRGTPYVQSSDWNEFSNDDGKFDIEAIGPGIYQVQIAVDGFAWTWSEEINTDENKPVTIGLSTGGSIKGLVVNSRGERVSGAKVIPLSKAASPRWEETFVSEEGLAVTVNGEFLIKNIAEGQETIKVSHPDYCRAIVKDIDVVEGVATEGVEIVLEEGGTIQGHVYDALGKPQSDVTLYIQDGVHGYEPVLQKAGQLALVLTDANGFYRATGLPEQLCYVKRSDEQYFADGVAQRAVFPTNGETTELDFGGRPVIRGRLILDSEPLEKTKVTLGDLSNVHSRIFKCNATTDSQGRFSFMSVPVGRYVLYYQVPNKRNNWTNLTSLDVGDEDANIGEISLETGKITVSLSSADPKAQLDDLRVYLQQGFDFWGPTIGNVSNPERPGDPYRITNVLSGKYTVAAYRPDGVKIIKKFEFNAASGEHEISLQVPAGTATVSGELISDSDQPLLLWRSDGGIIGHIRRPSNGSEYKIENLPAGRYSIGNYFIGNAAPLLDFSLSEGQNKTIDIDTSGWAELNKASLHTRVIGTNGVPIIGAQVWLKRGGQEIDPMTAVGHGQFFIADPGEYSLHAYYPGHKETVRKVRLESGDISSVREEDAAVIIRLKRKE